MRPSKVDLCHNWSKAFFAYTIN